jgi:hypothetical protein
MGQMKITPGRIVRALKSVGLFDYGMKAPYTWPVKLRELQKLLKLSDSERSALGKKLRRMRSEVRKYGVFYAYYPTGWRYDPTVLKKRGIR